MFFMTKSNKKGFPLTTLLKVYQEGVDFLNKPVIFEMASIEMPHKQWVNIVIDIVSDGSYVIKLFN
jgi:hypothetical protein